MSKSKKNKLIATTTPLDIKPLIVPEINTPKPIKFKKLNPALNNRFVDIQNICKKHLKEINEILSEENTNNKKPSRKQKKLSLNIIKKMDKIIKAIEKQMED